ncbi:hypothetical protein RHSIM_Rhsim11G0026200 [Rhododendron simsii]|uniref:Uncharacterized protein n=1 Tax=Rhododendron simsii TaxID=118357 RepID=A0A834G6Z9_RHOSS|nr:hypothetical protein RHSIM_Rhsim11G0026200 [Rhododendron simsii]
MPLFDGHILEDVQDFSMIDEEGNNDHKRLVQEIRLLEPFGAWAMALAVGSDGILALALRNLALNLLHPPKDPLFQLFLGVVVSMARTKQVGEGSKGKQVAASAQQESEDDFVEESDHDAMEEDSEEEAAPLETRTGQREKRRKRRTPEQMEADAKLDWVESIPLRGFKCERNVSRRSFADDKDILNLLHNQGLNFWTRALPGYNAAGVIEFYQNLDISEALTNGIVKSKVHNRRIVVDSGMIAKYLRYDRPPGDLLNYPRSEPLDTDMIIHDLYSVIPKVGVPPHVPGKFKDIYRVLNQIVHYNLYPRGAENKPSKKSARFSFLRDKGISKGPYEKLDPPSPGTITKAVLVKSKSQSKAAAAGTSAGQSASAPPEPSLWSVPDPKASKESIWRKLCCQNIAIWNCIQKEKKERKKLAREVGELKHELNWHTRYIESTTDEKYEAPPRAEEAESEEEVLFGPGAVPGGQ